MNPKKISRERIYLILAFIILFTALIIIAADAIGTNLYWQSIAQAEEVTGFPFIPQY